jgi:hypothetical protein
MVPHYIHPATTEEDLKLIFSGKDQVLNTPIIWVGNRNELHYFVSQLKRNRKITNGRFFEVAKNLFVDMSDQPFQNLRNNKETPKNSYKIRIIVNLF